MQRRDVLKLLGLAAAAAACSSSGRRRLAFPVTVPTTTTSATAASCVLAPEQTEGPFYVDTNLVRRDITDGRRGEPFELGLTVVDASTCAPIPNAILDVWHADADGQYSGFQGVPGRALRGLQRADQAGRATFRSIYPGWYPGRTPHIHVKVHLAAPVVHTGQLYFDEGTTDAVYAGAPYNERGRRDTTNATDTIYARGGRASMLTIERRPTGLRGTITLGVRR